MDKRQIVYLATAGVLALTTVFLIHSYLQSEHEKLERLLKSKGFVEVVVARKDIPAHTKITRDMLTLKKIPADQLEPQALTSLESAVDKIAEKDIIESQQITASLLLLPRAKKSLALKTPEGKRAVTIPVDKISSIEGMINPGDRVDIIGTFQVPVAAGGGKTINQSVVVPMFQNVLVLAVGLSTESSVYSQEGGGKQPTTVTVALTPEEASLLIYALEIGKVRLLLRSPLDEKNVVSNEPLTVDKLWEKLLGIKQIPPPPPPPTVEVYKGTEKTSVVVEEK